MSRDRFKRLNNQPSKIDKSKKSENGTAHRIFVKNDKSTRLGDSTT